MMTLVVLCMVNLGPSQVSAPKQSEVWRQIGMAFNDLLVDFIFEVFLCKLFPNVNNRVGGYPLFE
jgi:hypothetical protein